MAVGSVTGTLLSADDPRLQTLLDNAAPASTTLESAGEAGPGKWVTIYANPSHA